MNTYIKYSLFITLGLVISYLLGHKIFYLDITVGYDYQSMSEYYPFPFWVSTFLFTYGITYLLFSLFSLLPYLRLPRHYLSSLTLLVSLISTVWAEFF